MRRLFCTLAICLWVSSAHAEIIFLEGFTGHASISPTDFNSERAGFIWNNTAASPGTFNKLSYTQWTAGVRLTSRILISASSSMEKQELPTGNAGSGFTVHDSFVYQPLVYMLNFRLIDMGSIIFNVSGGVGKAGRFEFHQHYSGTNEDIQYTAKPAVQRYGGELVWMPIPILGLAFEAHYDHVRSSSLTAAGNYQATVNGNPIRQGDRFGNSAVVDMSGMRYGIGLRVAF